jgi:hypothetical protein
MPKQSNKTVAETPDKKPSTAKSSPFLTLKSKFLSIRNPLLQSLIVAGVWQVVMTGFCVLFANVILQQNTQTAENVLEGNFLFKYMTNWDGTWYAWITQGAYAHTEGVSSFSPAFYPLFPFLVWIFSLGNLIDITLVALLINTVALTFSVYFLRKIQSKLLPQIKNEWALVILFFLVPAVGFQNWFYTEAISCALVFGAYYFAIDQTRKHNWAICALLLGFSTASRLPSFLFVGLCGLEYLKQTKWRLDKRAFWFLLAPLGFVAYGLWLLHVRGDFMMMFHSEEYWWYHQFSFNIIFTYMKTLVFIFLGYSWPAGWFVSYLLPMLMIALLLFSSIYLIRKKKQYPLAVFGIVCCMFFPLNSNVISVHRYLLPAITIYVAMAMIYYDMDNPKIARYRRAIQIIFAVFFIFQIMLDIIFLSYTFAG